MVINGTPKREREQRERILVAIRCRPMNEKEESTTGNRRVVKVLDDQVLIFDPKEDGGSRFSRMSEGTRRRKNLTLGFDRVFDECSTQEEVYRGTAAPLIPEVLEGINTTVFAYGATGAGKTHTMIGSGSSGPGVMVQALRDLFEQVDAVKEEYECKVLVSYMEVYNEQIRDLLVARPAAAEEANGHSSDMAEDTEMDTSMGDAEEAETPVKQRAPVLDLCEDDGADGGRPGAVMVRNLTWHEPEGADELFELLERGNEYRAHSPTEANALSSRSHAVLQIAVHRKKRISSMSESWTVGKLSLIDLAGSERASMTQNRGERLIEGANINKSLLALGNCINALCSGKTKGHIPYRDSKLTRLLKDSLGGNCRTVMIANVTSSSVSYDDTHNTLKYANRAKSIKTKVSSNVVNVNAHVAQYKNIIKKQEQELILLRQQLELAKSSKGADSEKERAEKRKADLYRSNIRQNLTRTMSALEKLAELHKKERNLTRELAVTQDRREQLVAGEGSSINVKLSELAAKNEHLERKLQTLLRSRLRAKCELEAAQKEGLELENKVTAFRCCSDRSKVLELEVERRRRELSHMEVSEELRRTAEELQSSKETIRRLEDTLEKVMDISTRQADLLGETGLEFTDCNITEERKASMPPLRGSRGSSSRTPVTSSSGKRLSSSTTTEHTHKHRKISYAEVSPMSRSRSSSRTRLGKKATDPSPAPKKSPRKSLLRSLTPRAIAKRYGTKNSSSSKAAIPVKEEAIPPTPEVDMVEAGPTASPASTSPSKITGVAPDPKALPTPFDLFTDADSHTESPRAPIIARQAPMTSPKKARVARTIKKPRMSLLMISKSPAPGAIERPSSRPRVISEADLKTEPSRRPPATVAVTSGRSRLRMNLSPLGKTSSRQSPIQKRSLRPTRQRMANKAKENRRRAATGAV